MANHSDTFRFRESIEQEGCNGTITKDKRGACRNRDGEIKESSGHQTIYDIFDVYVESIEREKIYELFHEQSSWLRRSE